MDIFNYLTDEEKTVAQIIGVTEGSLVINSVKNVCSFNIQFI